MIDMKPDIRRVATIVLLVLGATSVRAGGERPDPRLAAIHTVFIEKMAPNEANDRVSACLAEKFKEHGVLSAVDAPDKADAVLKIDATIPNVATRYTFRMAEAEFTVATPGGEVLWKGQNKFKKGSAVWGGKLDAACGIANGISKDLMEVIKKAQATRR
jgi:hypothetical protein